METFLEEVDAGHSVDHEEARKRIIIKPSIFIKVPRDLPFSRRWAVVEEGSLFKTPGLLNHPSLGRE